MKWFNLKSISTRLFLWISMIPIMMIALIFFTLFILEGLQLVSLANIEQSMLAAHKVKIKALATSMATALGEGLKEIEGREAREAYVRRIIDPIRFFPNHTGYYFAYRLDGTRVALPTAPHLVGRNSFKEKPPAPSQIRDFIEKAKKGGGFSQWYWGKPGEKGMFLKQGYVAPIPGTDLLLLTAVYIDDIETEKAAVSARFDRALEDTVTWSIVAGAVILFGVLPMFLFFVQRGVLQPIRKVTSAAKAIEDGDFSVAIPRSAPHEMGEMVQAFKQMVRKRQEAEEEAVKRQHFLASVLLHVPDAIIILDARHKVLDWNPGAEKLFGYNRAVTLGMDLDNLVARGDAHGEATEFTRSVLAGEKLRPVDTVRYRRDGSPVNVIASGTPIYSGGELQNVVAVYTDITEMKKQQAALHASETHLRTVIETIPDLIWLKDPDGVYLACNPRFERFFGAKETEIVGKTDYDFIDKELADFFREKDRAALAANKLTVNEEEVTYADDGHRELLETIKTPMYDSEGKLVGVLGIARDITERKHSEETLRESEEKYSNLFYHSNDAILIHDFDGNIIDVNQKMLELFGYTKSEISFIKVQILHPVEAFVKSKLAFEAIIREGFVRFEIEFKKKSGELFPAEVSSSLFEIGGKKVVQGIIRDITERQHAEEQIKTAKNYISNIINSMPSILVSVDQDGKVTQWNRDAEHATGISSEEAEGKPLEQAFPRLGENMELVQEAVKNHQVQFDLRKAWYRDGETFFKNMTIYPLITNGAEGAVIRVDDVTEKVRMEEMMVQSEKMLSVGGLAAGMAHEINNPLAGMMQTTEVMTDRLTGDLAANDRAAAECGIAMAAVTCFMEKRGIPGMLGTIRDTGRRAADIVKSMLNFSRKSDAVKSSHDLAVLLDQTVELAATDYDLKKKYDFRQIEIVREYEAGLPLVPCEAQNIQQVLLNILKNGAEAMQEKAGPDRPRFVLGVSGEKGMVQVEIVDNGPGLDEATCKRVFEPFFTTKPQGVGTGLGLSVSYFIITENHGGTMAVESVPGKGAKFIVRLPVEREG